jgi:hypothetical protein
MDYNESRFLRKLPEITQTRTQTAINDQLTINN